MVLTRSDDRGFPPLVRADGLVERTLALLGELGQPALEEIAGGVSDGSWASHVGVPTVDGLGPVGGLDHSPDEYIDLRSVAAARGHRRRACVASDAEAPSRTPRPRHRPSRLGG